MLYLLTIIAFIFLIFLGSITVYFIRKNKKEVGDGSDFEILEEE
jgi:hypothetical protein